MPSAPEMFHELCLLAAIQTEPSPSPATHQRVFRLKVWSEDSLAVGTGAVRAGTFSLVASERHNFRAWDPVLQIEVLVAKVLTRDAGLNPAGGPSSVRQEGTCSG